MTVSNQTNDGTASTLNPLSKLRLRLAFVEGETLRGNFASARDALGPVHQALNEVEAEVEGGRLTLPGLTCDGR